jgi:hypothetical protein
MRSDENLADERSDTILEDLWDLAVFRFFSGRSSSSALGALTASSSSRSISRNTAGTSSSCCDALVLRVERLGVAVSVVLRSLPRAPAMFSAVCFAGARSEDGTETVCAVGLQMKMAGAHGE